MSIDTLKSIFVLPHLIRLGLVVVGLGLSASGLYFLWQDTNHACLTETSSLNPDISGASATQSAQLATKPVIYIDIAGAVANPGLYELEMGDRMAELISQAGGFSKAADTQYVSQDLNLAKQLKDGDKVYIPTKQEAAAQRKATTVSSTSRTITRANQQLVSINAATLEDLDELPGIGEKRAQEIIDGRPYAAVNELVDRKIVTQTIFDDIVQLISL